MRTFCTYFDAHFLPRALALIESLRQHSPGFRLWALCLDAESEEALRRLDLPEVKPISLAEFERADPELLQAKENRSRLEYYFTCTPSLPLYVLDRCPEVELITYIDADLFFFADPQPLYDELGDGSVGIIAHRYSRGVQDHERYGIYNVGWLMFRRDPSGLACLRWWRERCLEWCHARLEGDRYADQKYLDQWPALFPNVRVLQHKGANLGPWNLANYRITERAGRVMADEQPLLFYHFSSFLRVAPWLYNTNLAYWRVRPSSVVRRRIIGAYIATLEALRVPATPVTAPSASASPSRQHESKFAKVQRKLRAVGRILGGLLAQDHLLVLRRQVL